MIILGLNILLLTFLIGEYLYSVYKKDNIYEKWEFLGNLLNGVVLNAVSYFFGKIYLTLAEKIHLTSLHHYIQINVFNFILCVIFVDFCYYIFHRLHHMVPTLWHLHTVHHGDNMMNMSTSYRISWIEHTYFSAFFFPVFLIGFSPFTIVLSIYFLSLYQAFCHSRYIQFPKWFTIIFITPQTHLIHHYQNKKYHNTNYGGIFSIWDKTFNTFCKEAEAQAIGISNYKETNCFVYQYKSLKKILHLQ